MDSKPNVMFILLIFLTFSFLSLAYINEPECTCSKFHYEEQLLEKMIRTEMKFQALKEQIDAKLGDFAGEIKDMSAAVNTKLDTFKANNEEFVELNEGLINDTVNKIENIAKVVKSRDSPQVSFRSKKAVDLTLEAGQVIIFQEVLYNSGSGYDSSTGKFTAPVNGTYLFTCQLCQYSSKHIHYGIVVDGIEVHRGFFSTGQTICTSFDAILALNATQKVWIQSFYPNQLYEDVWRWNTFSGVLLQ